MKILTLSRNKLDIAKTQLKKPLMTIGRSPSCDVVLRAPGIQAVHFIIEWLGSGKFNSESGSWSITDVSKSESDSAGVVLTREPVSIGDLSFHVVDSLLESSEMIGGGIVESLEKGNSSEPDLIEFVQVRTDSGAIEEIRHFGIKNKEGRIESLSREFKSFKVEHPQIKTDAIINIILSEMPGADLSLSGRAITAKDSLPLHVNDFLRVKWNGRDFYLRFVEEIKAPPIPMDFWGSPLLKKLTIGTFSVLAAIIVGTLVIPKEKEEEKPPELPRVARVEIPPPPPPVKVEKEPVVEPEIAKPEPQKIQKKSEPKKVAAKPTEMKVSTQKAPQVSRAVAPKVVKAPKAPPKAGLNSEAPVKNVNQVGLLGALNKSPKKGPGIQADRLMNEAVIQDTATGSSEPKIVLKTPPSGVLGSGRGGSPNSKSNEESLASASTTLSGISKPNPNSTGLIARNGGKAGMRLGTEGSGADGDGAFKGSAGKGASGIGNIDGGEFSVSGGGLDRETVRRIILSYRSQIRTCYERAMISNPNLEGRITYRWQITPQGSVISAQISKATVESGNLKSCVLEVIQGMNFPAAPNGRSTTVIYPFQFTGKK